MKGLCRMFLLRSAVMLSAVVAVFAPLSGVCDGSLHINNYYSPRNAERPEREATMYIILHTTEGPRKGSLRKVYDRGEAHYFVDAKGRVLRIVHRDRVALHAGRSMWDGRTNLDNVSLGIEVEGYHDRDITEAQYAAIKELLAQLQRIYKVPDDKVLTHSMIAYGAPNRWHRRSHRGRKRCGMLFASDRVRGKLGLESKPSYDPDVKAGRLAVGDPYLARVLYSSGGRSGLRSAGNGGSDVISEGKTAWDIARDMYAAADTLYVFPDGRKIAGDRIRDWKRVPAGTKVVLAAQGCGNESEKVEELGVDGATAQEIAGEEFDRKTTLYILPGNRVKRGDEMSESEFESLPGRTRLLVGYVDGGRITEKRSAFDVCGKRWNFPSTFYLFPDGRIVSGDSIRETAIPKNALVFFRR